MIREKEVKKMKRHRKARGVKARGQLSMLEEIDARLARLEEIADRLNDCVSGLRERLLAIDEKLEYVIQSRVMDAADEKEALGKFARGFLALTDLVEDKLRMHRAKSVRPDMLRRLAEVVNGKFSVGEWCAYLGRMGADAVLPAAYAEKWADSMNEIAQKTKELLPNASSVEDVNRMALKFDGRTFAELLIVPTVGERYDDARMYARTVEPGDASSHVVDEVVKFGLVKSCGLDGMTKAVVKVKS